MSVNAKTMVIAEKIIAHLVPGGLMPELNGSKITSFVVDEDLNWVIGGLTYNGVIMDGDYRHSWERRKLAKAQRAEWKRRKEVV